MTLKKINEEMVNELFELFLSIETVDDFKLFCNSKE